MMIQAVLGNPHHPEYGVATIPFPIPRDQHAHCMELLEALEIGDAMRLAKLEGIQPMLYTHPVGTFGHGAGPAIGMYTNQGFVAGTGERVIDEDTCFALELNVYDNLACWDGQRVFMYLEEDICRAAFDNPSVASASSLRSERVSYSISRRTSASLGS